MKKYTMFLDWKNQYTENEYTTQRNLQIQQNSSQMTNGILHRYRAKNFTICIGWLPLASCHALVLSQAFDPNFSPF